MSKPNTEPWIDGWGLVVSVERPGAKKLVEVFVTTGMPPRYMIGICEDEGCLTYRKLKPGTRISFEYRRGRNGWKMRNVHIVALNVVEGHQNERS